MSDAKNDAMKSKDFDSFHALRQRKRANEKLKQSISEPNPAELSQNDAADVTIKKFISSIREAVGAFIESETLQKIMIVLIILDVCSVVALLFIEARVFQKSSITLIVGWFSVYYPVAMLAICAIEILLLFFAFGPIFHLGYTTDFVIIGACFMTNLSPTEWRAIRLLSIFRLWRVVRLVNTVINRIQTRIDELQDNLNAEKKNSSELRIAKSRAEDKERSTLKTVTDMTHTIQEQVSKIDTLQEALNIAALNWAEVVAATENEGIEDGGLLLDNNRITRGLEGGVDAPAKRFVINESGKFSFAVE